MQESKIRVNNSTIYYWVRSSISDTWVLFLHGAGLDHRMFDSQINAVPAEFPVLAWDARCHGKSTSERPFVFDEAVQDLLAIIDAHGIRQVVLIGQSMGGNVAQELTKIRPDLVKGLVVIDATRNTQTMTALEKFYVKITPALLRTYPRNLLIEQSANACGVKQSTRDYVKACFERMPTKSFVGVMSSLLTCIKPDPMYRESCPMLLICGEEDKSGNIKKVMQSWPGQVANFIPNAGHNSNQDQPELVNKLIVGFLKDYETTSV